MRDKSNTIFQKTAVVFVGAMLCCFLWGSAFPGIKLGYQWMEIGPRAVGDQILFAGIRFTLAGIFAIIVGSMIQGKILYPNRNSIGKVVKLSCMQTVLQYMFFYIGLANTTGVKASIIEGMNVFVAIFVASIVFGQEELTKRKMLGSVLGFFGVVLVNIMGNTGDFSLNLLGDGFIFLSTVAYAFSSVFLKRYSKEENPVMLSGYQFVFGGICMAVMGFAMGGSLLNVNAKGIGMLVYLAMVSAIAYSLWGILLKYNPVSKVAVFGFMNPVFGVILSAFCLGEINMINWSLGGGLILVCAGIFIVNKQ